MTAASTAYSGISQANAEKFRGKVAARNADMDRQSAQDALERGRIEEQQQYRRNAQRLGAQRAAMAANGIEVGFGSAADVQEDTALIGWQDARTIRENANREAHGFSINAWNNDAQASVSKSAAKGMMIGTAMDVGSTLLDGAQQYRKMGAPVKAAKGA